MISSCIISQIKTISILEYLWREGYTHHKIWGTNYRFYSPLRADKNASFDVDIKKNVWIDRGTNEGGDIIQLVTQYRQCSFQEAVEELSKLSFISSFRQPSHDKKIIRSSTGITEFRTQPLSHPSLLNYLASRSIDPKLAQIYLLEAHYRSGKKQNQYFSLAWKNKLGGYELRNQYFKGCFGRKGYTFIRTQDHSRILLFEGMIDFLSYLTLCNQVEPEFPSLILNSTTILNDDLIDKLRAYEIHCYFDNDDTGQRCFCRLQSEGIKVVDRSNEYENQLDLNDYLVWRKKI